MSDEHRDIISSDRIGTTADLGNQLQLNNQNRNDMHLVVARLKQTLDLLDRHIGADEERQLVWVAQIAVAGKEKGDERVVSYARELLGAMLRSEDRSEAMAEVQNKYSDLDLIGLVPPEMSEPLDIKPEVNRLLRGSVIAPDLLDSVQIEEAQPIESEVGHLELTENSEITDKDGQKKIVETKTLEPQTLETVCKEHSAVNELLNNPHLQFSYDNQIYFSLRNIASVFETRSGVASDIQTLTKLLSQTLIPAWYRSRKLEYDKKKVGRALPEYDGRIKFLDRAETESLLLFAARSERYSKYISHVEVTVWPDDISKKKVKN